MELKEYFKILKKNYRLFAGVVMGVLVFGLVGWSLIGVKYRVVVDLDVTRTGYQNDTKDYRYDEFYRLQADERFADTVVRWLESDRIKKDIYQGSSEASFEKLKAQRLSSQVIKVSFLVKDKNLANKVTHSIYNILNDKTVQLNLEQKNPNWFKILTSDPFVTKYQVHIIKLLVALLAGGIFLAFWTVFIKHYLEK